MSDSFSFSCPACGATFEVPVSFCGQTAECAECDSAFVLPTQAEFEAAMSATCVIDTTELVESQSEHNDMEDTGTVKIDRASIGMIPDLKESFDFDSD